MVRKDGNEALKMKKIPTNRRFRLFKINEPEQSRCELSESLKKYFNGKIGVVEERWFHDIDLVSIKRDEPGEPETRV